MEQINLGSVEFVNFKDSFLFPFVFQPIERPHFNKFLEMHFNIYNMLYKKNYKVQEYAKIALDENEVIKYGMQLKEVLENDPEYFNKIKSKQKNKRHPVAQCHYCDKGKGGFIFCSGKCNSIIG